MDISCENTGDDLGLAATFLDVLVFLWLAVKYWVYTVNNQDLGCHLYEKNRFFKEALLFVSDKVDILDVWSLEAPAERSFFFAASL